MRSRTILGALTLCALATQLAACSTETVEPATIDATHTTQSATQTAAQSQLGNAVAAIAEKAPAALLSASDTTTLQAETLSGDKVAGDMFVRALALGATCDADDSTRLITCELDDENTTFTGRIDGAGKLSLDPIEDDTKSTVQSWMRAHMDITLTWQT